MARLNAYYEESEDVKIAKKIVALIEHELLSDYYHFSSVEINDNFWLKIRTLFGISRYESLNKKDDNPFYWYEIIVRENTENIYQNTAEHLEAKYGIESTMCCHSNGTISELKNRSNVVFDLLGHICRSLTISDYALKKNIESDNRDKDSLINDFEQTANHLKYASRDILDIAETYECLSDGGYVESLKKIYSENDMASDALYRKIHTAE